jgi:cytoskeletal protein CcmA (bactofilin family)
MFGKSKDDSDKLPAAIQQPQSPSATEGAAPVPGDQISAIGRSMTVIGKIVVDEGTVHVLGQIEGELQASTVLIGEGARVEGDLVAQELTVGGTVKGTIRANRVKLNSTAVVEGDIFHRSLSIEENARFEGMSKREDSAGDVPRTSLQQPAAHDEVQTKATAIQANGKSNGAQSHDEPLALEHHSYAQGDEVHQ